MSDLDLDVAFNINEEEVAEATRATRERIRAVGEEVQAQNEATEASTTRTTRTRVRAAQVEAQAVDAAAQEMRESIHTVTVETQAQAQAAEVAGHAMQESARAVSAAVRTSGQAAGRSFNGLQNSINQISRELPAFTVSTQTGFLAISNNLPILADELSRARAANAALTASGQTAIPVWKQLLTSVFSWGTALSVGITLLTVYGKQIGELIASLFKGKEAINATKLAQQDLNKALESSDYKKAVININELRTNIDLAKRGLLDKKEVVDEYNKSIGKVTGQVANLDQAERALAANGEAYVKMMLYKAAANLALEEAAKKAVEAAQKMNQTDDEAYGGFDSYLFSGVKDSKYNDVYKKGADRRRIEQAAEVEKEQKAQEKIASDFQKKAAEISSKYKFDFFGKYGDDKKEESSFANILASRKGVLDRLAALDAEYARKAFTKDDEEKQALKDKFKDFRKIIENENTKIAAYNKTHKNQLGTIDVSQVQPIEDRAMQDLEYKQGTDKLKISLDAQKKLYKEYEDYKTAFGETKANERFKNELDTSKTYMQLLANEQKKLTDEQSKAPLSGLQKDRLKMVETALKEEKTLTDANMVKMLADLQGFEAKRAVIAENALVKMQQLRAKGKYQEADNLRKQTEAELTEFDKKRVEQLDSYKALFENIDRMGTSALRTSLSSLQKEVGKLQLTPKAKEFFDKLFGNTKKSIDTQSANDFKNIASALNEAAQYAGNLGKGLATVLSTAASLAGQVGNIKQSISDFKTAQGNKDVFGQISSGFGLFSAGLGIASLFKSVFDNSQKQAEQQEYNIQQQVKATEALNKALERQLALTKDIQGPERLNAYKKDIADISQAQKDATAQLAGLVTVGSGDKDLDAIVAKANSGEELRNKFGKTEKRRYDDYVKELKRTGQYLDLTKLSVSELNKLMDSGKLDEKTSAIVQNLINLEQQAKDTMHAFVEEITGMSLDSLNDEIKSLFDNGEATVENFANVLEKSIKGAITNAFKRNEIETAMEPFYKQLADAGKDGVFSDEEIATLRAQKDAIAKTLADRAAAYEKIIGADDSLSDKNSLQGAYKTASQESIDLLSANTGGLRISTVEGNNLTKVTNATLADGVAEIKKQTLSIMEIAENTKNTATNTAEISETLKSMDRKMDDNKNYAAGTGRAY